MKKFLKKTSLVFMLLLLTACCKINIEITVNNDCSSTCKGSIYMKKTSMEQLDMDSKSLVGVLEEYGIALEEGSYRESVKVIDGEEYRGLEYDLPGDSFFDAYKGEDNMMHVVSNKGLNRIVFDSDVLEDGNDKLDIYDELGMEATMTIRMPGKISYSSSGIVDKSQREVSFNMIDLDGKIEVVSNILATEKQFIIMGASLVVVVLLTIICAKKLKTKKKVEASK